MSKATDGVLGRQTNAPVDRLDTIPWAHGKIVITIECTEFTSLCPVTSQPDFGRLTIEYEPSKRIVETKSLKLFLWRYRDRAAFNEQIVAEVAADFHGQVKPRWVRVTGHFNTRGGLGVHPVATKGKAP